MQKKSGKVLIKPRTGQSCPCLGIPLSSLPGHDSPSDVNGQYDIRYAHVLDDIADA